MWRTRTRKARKEGRRGRKEGRKRGTEACPRDQPDALPPTKAFRIARIAPPPSPICPLTPPHKIRNAIAPQAIALVASPRPCYASLTAASSPPHLSLVAKEMRTHTRDSTNRRMARVLTTHRVELRQLNSKHEAQEGALQRKTHRLPLRLGNKLTIRELAGNKLTIRELAHVRRLAAPLCLTILDCAH